MKKCKRTLSLLCAIVLIVTLVAPTAMALQGPDVSVPQDYELIYFADCGANAFPTTIQTLLAEHADTVKNPNTPDQAYNGTWGYTNSPEDMEANNTTSQDIYESIRNFKAGKNGQTLQYKFAAEAGQYKVYVGLYDPWTQYNNVRQAAVSVNNGNAQTLTYYQGARLLSFDTTATGSDGLTVDIAPLKTDGGDNYDVLVSFIMVTRKVEEPQPEAPEAPTAATSIWGKGGEGWKLDIISTCTNENAAHKGGNEKTEHKNFISGKYFTFGDMTLSDGVWQVPAQFNAAMYLEEIFVEPHTAQNVSVTLEYVNNRWSIQTDEDKAYLRLEGTCAVSGPTAPELDTNLTVWVQLYEGTYDPVTGMRIDMVDPTTYAQSLTFGEPYKDGETWKCEMTILGYTQDEEKAAYCPVNQMMPEGYELDPSQAAAQTITLTFNQSTAMWVCPELSREYTSNGPGDTTSKTQYGVAFLIRPVPQETAPEGPNSDNCDDFYVTVYGKEPRTDYMYYSVRQSRKWDLLTESQATITFSQVTKNGEGQWVCTATVNAAGFVAEVASNSAAANFFPMDEPTTKTVILTYNESTGEWVAAPDGITYGYPGSPETRNGVAFGLEKRYTVTFAPGRDLKFQAPTGEAPESMVCAPGATVELPETCQFVTENGIFAGWKTTIGSGVNSQVHFYPIGTDMTMFNQDVVLEAYWMDVELNVASVPYDASLAVKDYTFGSTASFAPEGDSITLLYRAKVLGNGNYPYILTCDGAQAVYDTALSGTLAVPYTGGQYVYFTVTYTAEEAQALTEETVSMGSASASVALTVEEPAPALPVPGTTVLYFADGEWVEVTCTCTNENAVHKPANTKTGKKLSIPREYLKAAENAQKDENGVWTCQVTLDAAAMLSGSYGFNMAHTGEDLVLTAVYNEAKARWELPAEAIQVEGTCTQNGPEAPSKDNCTDFYITVYGHQPQVDDSVVNSALRSTLWSLVGDGVAVTFSQPVKNNQGVWTSTATVAAEDWVEEIYESFASSNYRRDDTDPTTKTITLTFDQVKGKWVAESDGVTYGYPSNPSTKNGVAFRLVKQYTVTFAPGRDTAYQIPAGDEQDGGAYDKGAAVPLPQTTHFVAENGVFAGWLVKVKNGTKITTYYYPLGTETMTMFGTDVDVEAYWMNVELEVASVPYDESMAVKDYTFADSASFVIDGDSVTVLYRAKVIGNSQYPYALTSDGAQAVYDSQLTGTIDKYQTSKYVYFTVTYTAEEFAQLTQQTVTMGNASASASVTVTVEHTVEAVAAVAPTCTQDGSKAYWHCTGCGKYFADEACTQEITEDIDTWKVIPATGHAYDEPEFTWSDDGKTCTVTFTCGNDATHVETMTAEVTSAVKTAPTCTEKGVTVYTAKVNFLGVDYTDTLELTDIPAAGHHYEDGVCTVCGEKDPDYVEPTEPTTEPTKPATDPEGPDQTGETTPVALLIGLLLISAACLSVIIAKARKVRF